MKNRTAVVCFIFAIGVCACSNPYDTKLPSNLEDEIATKAFKESIKTLPEEEKAALAKFMVRMTLGEKMGGLFGVKATGGIPNDITVKMALAEQKAFEEEQAKKRAAADKEQEELKKKEEEAQRETQAKAAIMRDVFSVKLVSKEFVPLDFGARRMNDTIALSARLTNLSKKDIAGAKGAIEFRDIFDDLVLSLNLSFDDGIKASESIVWNGGFEFNRFKQNHKKLADTPLEKLKIAWIPEVYIFADGSRME